MKTEEQIGIEYNNRVEYNYELDKRKWYSEGEILRALNSDFIRIESTIY